MDIRFFAGAGNGGVRDAGLLLLVSACGREERGWVRGTGLEAVHVAGDEEFVWVCEKVGGESIYIVLKECGKSLRLSVRVINRVGPVRGG